MLLPHILSAVIRYWCLERRTGDQKPDKTGFRGMRYSFRLPTLHFMTAYVALGLFGGSFPDTDPTIPFTPFPEYKPNTFTPFNAYDVSFFLVWLAIFLIYFNFFSPGRSKSHAKTAPPTRATKVGTRNVT